jgi:hypothetical protein
MRIAFQPAAHAVDVEVTLVADEPTDRDGETSQVWSVPPGGLDQTCDARCGSDSGCDCISSAHLNADRVGPDSVTILTK